MIHRVPPGHGQFTTAVTFEHGFISISDRPFSEPSDSGTFVFAEDGDVIGLLWGGAERRNISYVTPIEDIFDDIKRVTGAMEVRILE